MKKLKVKNFEQTCYACPSQWDIFIHEDEYENQKEYIYARYRWGILSVTLYNEEHPWGSGGKELVSKTIGGEMDGILDTEELIKHTKRILDWSKFSYLIEDNLDEDDIDENDEWWNSLSDKMKTLIRKEYE